MGYRSTSECVADLERNRHLVRITEEVDPHLEAAEIQRRVYAAGGPAIYFERLAGTPFPAVSNLFGTIERSRFIFRDTLERVKRAVELRADPTRFWRNPTRYIGAALAARFAPPKSVFNGPVFANECRVSELPGIVSWPDDGGPFITLPQVYTEDPHDPKPAKSNLGMYRIQLAGNDYALDREVGLHYQIHRGIGVHHSAALERNERLRVSVFVGGPPANTFAAVMPLPEGLSELLFAGLLAGRRTRIAHRHGCGVATDADFCIVGSVDPERVLPEGPFGDHLGYYSLVHDFPVLEVERVYHRTGAVWPFTVVGRPPQEDTSFGKLIHELTGPMVPASIPGLRAMHAVDEAGVHPLMLAIGSERYVPYRRRGPQELLTIANAVLGFSQASLAKYLVIAAGEDDPKLDLHDGPAFLQHVLRRIDLERDLHFHTKTTMDTLDYSGTGLNSGSKLVLAACGPPTRELDREPPSDLDLGAAFPSARLAMPGVMVVQGPTYEPERAAEDVEALAARLAGAPLQGVPLVVLADDAEFAAANWRNFAWVTFTRSNPSHDVHGVGARIEHKHWGCTGPLIIDARIKPHHAPPLIEDPAVNARVDALAAAGGPLHGIF